MKIKFISFSIILLFFSVNIFAQKQTAAKFVESFYEFHRARSGIFNAAEIDAHKKWFSPELTELFQNELKREQEFLRQNPTDKPHFGDGFPFAPYEECSSNGKNVKNVIKTALLREKKGDATVEVKFYQPRVCGGEMIDAYKVELRMNRNGWLIYDWIYPDNSRLTEDLKRTEY